MSTEHSAQPSPPPGPIPNAPYHLVANHIISWAATDRVDPPHVPHHNRSSTVHDEPVDTDSRAYQKYMELVGTYVAKCVFGYNDGPYFMDGLPSQYSLYTHHSQPKGKPRTDLYLYGPKVGKKTLKFRSPNEFTMHAVWLMGGGHENPSLCQCKYCGPVSSQRQINKLNRIPGQQGR